MTNIEWTDVTWNPVVGCSKVSAGCANCYAETMANRLQAMGVPAYDGTINERGRWTGKVNRADSLTLPLSWRKPRRIFVNSMSDLFHESISDAWIDEVLGVILVSSARKLGHVFQVLTKRADRMVAYFAGDWRNRVRAFGTIINGCCDPWSGLDRGRIANLWLGVSVENQPTADERIPKLLECHSAAPVLWLSMEPLLGEVSIARYLWSSYDRMAVNDQFIGNPTRHDRIRWVVVGGESGPNARPMHPDWVRLIRDDCAERGTPFFFKQWGEWGFASCSVDVAERERRTGKALIVRPNGTFDSETPILGGEVVIRKLGKRRAGRLLDGVEHNEFPEVRG